ncbi:MAG: response regulator [Cyanobacteria bacterium J06600_6]
MPSSILIVEDNDDIQLLFQMILESEGYEVNIASNGAEALESLETVCPQLILMDIMMPGISGIEVARNIKQQQDYESLPILLISAVDRLQDRQFNYSKASDILYKPFDLDDLVFKVDRLLKKHKLPLHFAST